MKPLVPLKRRLEKIRAETKMPWEGLERDFLFSWILAALAAHPELGQQLVFKGGSCLKKCYFGRYRFSEDLDFTRLEFAPEGAALERAIEEVCQRAVESLHVVGDVRLECSRYVEKEAHPHGQEAFLIRGQLPWQSSAITKVKIEITREEALLCPAEHRAILHEYGDELEGHLLTYSLTEIVAEKLRAILQQVAKREARGWIRPRARDYYDLWRILQEYPDQVDQTGFAELLQRKCKEKNVHFDDLDSFFPDVMVREVERTWNTLMRPLLDPLPDWSRVSTELRPLMGRLFV